MIIEKGVLKEVTDSDLDENGKIILTENIHEISSYAFAHVNAKEVVLPKTIKKVCSNAFRNCHNLEKVTLNDELEVIENSAFFNTNITSIKIPKNIKSIDSFCFYNCENLKEVIFNEGLESIDFGAFIGCDSLESLTFPKTLSTILDKAFMSCSNLKEINFNDNILSIKEGAFYDCSSLKEIVLPKKLKTLEDSVFFGCYNLEKITFNDNLVEISNNTFAHCASLKKITLPNNLEYLGVASFEGCDSLEKIELNETLQAIASKAFYNCLSLETISLPESLKRIGESAFENCSSLAQVKIPGKVTEINSKTFSGCENLEVAILSDGITTIDDQAFFACKNLSLVNFPESLKTIGVSSFEGCHSLENTKLNNNMETIKAKAFRYCHNLQNVQLSKNLKKIDKYAFEKTNIEELIIPENVETLGEYAFSSCENLKHLHLPNSLTAIGKGICKNAINLERVNIPVSLQEMPYACFYNTNLKDIYIPKNINKIDSFAFSFCKGLESIKLEEGLDKIESFAFSNCNSLEELNLPKSLSYIGINALDSDLNLKNISIYDTTRMDFQNIKNVNFKIINTKTNQNIPLFISQMDMFFSPNQNILTIADKRNIYCFDLDNNWVVLNKDKFETIMPNLDKEDYNLLHEWLKKDKFLPHYSIVSNMPVNEIDNFYLNSKKWGQLLNLSGVNLDEEKIAFFKLCYTLGVFEKSGTISNQATNFVKESIIPYTSTNQYYAKYGGLDIKNHGYNEEFAKLFLKNYKKDSASEFLVSKEGVDYLASTYNNFELIKKLHPNKSVNAKRYNDELTPLLCMLVLTNVNYENVTVEDHPLAIKLGAYGYSQSDFENAKKLFEIAKNIPREKISLHIKDDDEKEIIQYELLEKDNPLGAVLGDITNCCQKLYDTGRSCVEYGISKRNSKFMIFKSKQNDILGQAWVWYDESNQKICLDNIEIPRSVVEKTLKKKSMQEEFIKCLKRASAGFLSEMEEKGFEVSTITIGKGHNDLEGILTENFIVSETEALLSDYAGYTDAGTQYILYKKR